MREFSTRRDLSILRWLSVRFPADLHKRKTWIGGFTLTELLMVITVLGILSLMGMSAYSHFIDKAKNTRAIAEVRLLDKEIRGFFNSNDRLPDSLAEIGRETMFDPWKSLYQYINFETVPNPEDKWRTTGKESRGRGRGIGLQRTTAVNSYYDLYSMGKDGMSAPSLEDEASKDDIIRAADGSYIGLASEYN